MDKVLYKLCSFSHTEKSGLKDPAAIREDLCAGSYLVPINETFPVFIQKNLTAFKEKGFILSDLNEFLSVDVEMLP